MRQLDVHGIGSELYGHKLTGPGCCMGLNGNFAYIFNVEVILGIDLRTVHIYYHYIRY